MGIISKFTTFQGKTYFRENDEVLKYTGEYCKLLRGEGGSIEIRVTSPQGVDVVKGDKG